MSDLTEQRVNRRTFFARWLRGAGLLGLGGLAGAAAERTQADDTVWQLDPEKCIACARCATECVLEVSAVRVVHAHEMCGYCDLCTGYFEPDPSGLNTGAENQICPTGAIERTFIEEPYFEYNVNQELCIACARCVGGCTAFGNGSMFLQVNHDVCVNCNECSIGRACPSGAFTRVPASRPYLLKNRERLE